MGREVRRVPPDWEHPRDERTQHYKPMFEGERYESARNDWEEKFATEGMQAAIDWCGNPPDKNDYMPVWTPEQATHYMMYEDTSEGTPISPVFATPEELARWLVDNDASAVGDQGASYEGWLRIANGGYAPSMVMVDGVMHSGVDAP